ncbi:MAG: hypothetical protein QM705_15295 [Ancrocorticia sp.]
MEVSEWSEAVSATMAVISAAGAGFAWKRANISKEARAAAEQAKEEAVAAEQRAIETLMTIKELSANAQQQAESFKEVVAELKRANDPSPSGLTLEWRGKDLLILRNERMTTLRCEYVRNRDEFARIDLDDDFTIDSRRSIQFIATGAWELPMPNELILDEIGKDEPTIIPIPPKP